MLHSKDDVWTWLPFARFLVFIRDTLPILEVQYYYRLLLVISNIGPFSRNKLDWWSTTKTKPNPMRAVCTAAYTAPTVLTLAHIQGRDAQKKPKQEQE